MREENVQVYFYGDKSHIFHYLYPSSSLGIINFNQNIQNANKEPKLQKLLMSKGEIALFLIASYPSNTFGLQENPLEAELMKSGFKKVIKNHIFYYLKK